MTFRSVVSSRVRAALASGLAILIVCVFHLGLQIVGQNPPYKGRRTLVIWASGHWFLGKASSRSKTIYTDL